MSDSGPFAPGSAEARAFRLLWRAQVQTNSSDRADTLARMVRDAARWNPGLTMLEDVQRGCFKMSEGPDQFAGHLFRAFTASERYVKAGSRGEGRRKGAEFWDELKREEAAEADPAPNQNRSAQPSLCDADNPYGWPRHPRPGEDHGKPGEWNGWRQCYNGEQGEREARPTNPDHPQCCRRVNDESDEDYLLRCGEQPPAEAPRAPSERSLTSDAATDLETTVAMARHARPSQVAPHIAWLLRAMSPEDVAAAVEDSGIEAWRAALRLVRRDYEGEVSSQAQAMLRLLLARTNPPRST